MTRKITELKKLRFIVNGMITIFILLIVASQLQNLSGSIYSWLWAIPTIIINLLELFFLTRSLIKEPQNTDSRVSTIILSLGASMGFCLVAAAISSPQFRFSGSDVLHQTGIILAVLPYPFMLWALLCLKDCLTVIPEAHTIVANGIYKYSRHPLYICYIVWDAANIMMFPSWPMLAAGSTHISMLLLRLRREEQLLLDTFPEYHEYYLRTGLLGNKRSATI